MNSVEGPLYPGHHGPSEEDRYLTTVEECDIYVSPAVNDVLVVFGKETNRWDFWSPTSEWTDIDKIPESVRLHAQALYHLHQ